MSFARIALYALVVLLLGPASARADGPADNVAVTVRRVPKPGITLEPAVRTELEAGLAELREGIARVSKEKNDGSGIQAVDFRVIEKAVHDAITYQEFFEPKDVDRARELLRAGKRATAAEPDRRAPLDSGKGPIVRGYVSKIDGSPQPYGLVVPALDKGAGPPDQYRLDVWFHGRGETLSELNFIDQRRKTVGEFAPPNTIVLHPYGRYCNAFKFAGEVDVLEAIEDVCKRYRIDPDKISVRGFSMGGAACWQFAVHFPDRWFAANPGAGFAETPRFLKVFQRETLKPTWYEEKLWEMYDCDDVAVNLAQCPTVAYSGELDNQKQAADVMAEALQKEGIDLVHVIGPQTKHAYHPKAKLEVESRLKSMAEAGRTRFPREVRFQTYTLKYNHSNWVTVDALGEHWSRADVNARITGESAVAVKTANVTALTLSFPPGFAPFPVWADLTLDVDGTTIKAPRPKSDRSWSASLVKTSTGWELGTQGAGGLRKAHDLQGPIDDAFMDSFVFVRPTGKSSRPKVEAWVEAEQARAIEHWRRHFRGEARVVDDTALTDAQIASSNLILWGDPESNAVLKSLSGKLPIAWDAKSVQIGDKSYDAENHALILIYPNPRNPSRYIVLNSGFTFRDYDYLNNARQVPKLPDWAVVDLNTPPDSRAPGKVVAADFFGESWELRPEHKTP